MKNTITIKAVRFLVIFEDGSKSYLTLSGKQIDAAQLVGYPISAVIKDILGDKPIKFVEEPVIRYINFNLDEAWNALEAREKRDLIE